MLLWQCFLPMGKINVHHSTTTFTTAIKAMLSSAHTSTNFLLVVPREHKNKQ